MAKPLPISFAREMPSVWRADELARPVGAVVASGHALLDAQLPAGGWPVGGLVEVLQAQKLSQNLSKNPSQSRPQNGQTANRHDEWRLLLPALARTRGAVLLVGAPYQPFGPALAAQGLDPQRLLCVTTQTAAQRLWASEQALRCADVTAVLAWFPHVGPGQVRADQLRRLQMAASTLSKLLFVMRPHAAREESSPAVLRLWVQGPLQQPNEVPDGDALVLHILKRRGPPLAHALSLPARPARLATLLAVSRRRAAGLEPDKAAPPQAVPNNLTQSKLATFPASVSALKSAHMPNMPDTSGGTVHALDRIAAAA